MPKPTKPYETTDFLTACTELRQRMEAKEKQTDDTLNKVIDVLLKFFFGSRQNESK